MCKTCGREPRCPAALLLAAAAAAAAPCCGAAGYYSLRLPTVDSYQCPAGGARSAASTSTCKWETSATGSSSARCEDNCSYRFRLRTMRSPVWKPIVPTCCCGLDGYQGEFFKHLLDTRCLKAGVVLHSSHACRPSRPSSLMPWCTLASSAGERCFCLEAKQNDGALVCTAARNLASRASAI